MPCPQNRLSHTLASKIGAAIAIHNRGQSHAEAIRTLQVKEANDRAATLSSESTAKARLEADRILAEGKEQAQAIIEEETKKAQQYALLIIDKASGKAVSILEEANAQILALASNLSQKGRR